MRRRAGLANVSSAGEFKEQGTLPKVVAVGANNGCWVE